ncbi:efflux RND transporter periplasmic adaptor subunit [Entomohabitans teleogrylli]|uniref:efflux RND transporter periplasmic adaptor subunit n=1 Tax=Entomohabitans teleogrylli TaxID=1384589 RepID=UPI00073D355E|nr:efflux RND transporter periplasmic adaptor subunit [Entomohabitans teleogrylli]
MVKRQKRLFYFLAGPGLLIFAVGGITVLTPEKPTTVSAAAEQPALTVTTFSPEIVPRDDSLFATGNIIPWQEAVVSTEASGLSIRHLHADIGDEVQKGQLLAELQQDMVTAELEQTLAEMAQAEARLEEARADAGRARKLRGSSALSAQQVTQYLVAEKVARAQVAVLSARVKTARLRVAQTRITAPDAGLITARLAMAGQVVSPGDILFRLNRQSRLEWLAELPVGELEQIQPGQAVRLNMPGQAPVKGLVRQVAPVTDRRSRNGYVYVALGDNARVRAGSFATGHIITGRTTLPVIPSSALLLRDGFAYVFRVDAQSRVRQVPVITGTYHDGGYAIRQGVNAGDVLVAEGVGFLSDGDRVRVVPPPSVPDGGDLLSVVEGR